MSANNPFETLHASANCPHARARKCLSKAKELTLRLHAVAALETVVTRAPKIRAICTATVPTPPEAPLMSTEAPRPPRRPRRRPRGSAPPPRCAAPRARRACRVRTAIPTVRRTPCRRRAGRRRGPRSPRQSRHRSSWGSAARSAP